MDEPNTKRIRRHSNDDNHVGNDNDYEDASPIQPKGGRPDRITTPIDVQTLCVARSIGQLVGKMHAAGIIHGDLTTSNIMLKNPPLASNTLRSISSSSKNEDGDEDDVIIPLLDWTPQLVLIDFGLASSTTTTNASTRSNTSNNKGKNNAKQQHNAEEKAVDLYVLERAFLSSHPESERLVEELLDGYRDFFETLDLDATNHVVVVGVDTTVVVEKEENVAMETSMTSSTTAENRSSEGTHNSQAAKMILNRLEQVRMRGRKRECFG